MEISKMLESYDISDYHRLQCLGDSVSDILQLILSKLNVGVGVFEVGERIRSFYINEAFFTSIGYSKEGYARLSQNELLAICPDDQDGFERYVREQAAKKEHIEYTLGAYTEDKTLNYFHISGVCLDVEKDNHPIYLTVLNNVTEKKAYEKSIEKIKKINSMLMMQEERYKILEATAKGLLFEYNPETDIMVFSYNFPENKMRREIKNYSRFMDKSPMVHPDYIKAFKDALYGACKNEVEDNLEYLSTVSGGGYRWHCTHYKSVVDSDGNIISVMGRIEDIHEEKMERENLQDMAEKDGLTNMYRKNVAFEKMQKYMNDFPDGKYYFTLLDLDDFKSINDKYGHQYGDKILVDLSDNMRSIFGEDCLMGRFGGDEFVILTKDVSREELEEKLCRLKEKSHFCAGIVEWKTEEDARAVFNRADKAMYHVKHMQKNGIYIAD